MTNDEWMAEVQSRIAVSEGNEPKMYYDTKRVPTIGIGFNLTRGDTQTALATAGVPAAEIAGVINGSIALTGAQVNALFAYSFAPVVSNARQSLPGGIFDAMTDARRFVICDLVFNLGAAQWGGFTQTIALIAAAQKAKNSGGPEAHTDFVATANHMRGLDWYKQTGNRSMRDCAMMEVGIWCKPDGNGSDILS
jgi:GH24 family phage-related lysozyme (muramidase)